MANDLPPVNWLRTFEAAARNASFSGAARELGVTPSAVSQQVRLLELHLGTALFDRLPRGLALTLAGESYLPIVSESFERLTRGTLSLFGASSRERITVRAAAGFARFWLLPRLPRFIESHPELTLRLASATWAVEPFDSGIDLEIRLGTGPWPGFGAERLTWDEVFPVSSPRLRLASPLQLARHRLIHTIGFREGWSEWLAGVGLANLEPARTIEFDSLVLSLQLALEGEGVALGRTALVASLLENGRLTAPFPLRLEASEAFYLLWRSGRPLSAAMLRFRDWLLAEVEAEAKSKRPRRRPHT
jgi:LysR family transcriptional regulator, glycine cleavage system transcriptional activator